MTHPIPGTLFIVSAASGTGKTSLIHALLAACPDFRVSISHTTRPPRPSEEDKMHYHFVSDAEFKTLLEKNAFLECAEVFGYWYGTSEQSVAEQLAVGHSVILEIDWQGAQQIRQRFKEAVSIFILPPSLASLKERLESRNQDKPEVIARRLSEAQNEMSHCLEYDYLIINDKFGQALQELIAVVTSYGLKTVQQAKRQEALLKGLLS